MKSTVTRYIDATKETKATLAKLFDVTEKFVYMCLTHRQGTETETGRKIRYTAVKHYGAKPMLHVPECETFHDTTEDGREIMRQVFDNGAVLRADKHTGEAWVTDRKGVTVEHRDCVDIPELTELQLIAKNI